MEQNILFISMVEDSGLTIATNLASFIWLELSSSATAISHVSAYNKAR